MCMETLIHCIALTIHIKRLRRIRRELGNSGLINVIFILRPGLHQSGDETSGEEMFFKQPIELSY